MTNQRKRPGPLTYSQAKAQWAAKHESPQALDAVAGCLRHTSLTCWNDPRTGRLVFVVDSVSQWPNVAQTVGTTHLVTESGPFDSETVYRQAAYRFRETLEERYGRLT